MIEVLKQIQQCLKDKMYAHAEMYLHEAIADLESQEPVAWQFMNGSNFRKRRPDDFVDLDSDGLPYWKPLYTTPPQRTWVDLTRTQMQDVYFAVLEEHRGGHQMEGQLAFGEALQARLKERNT